jgi:hypothetical protein
VDSTTSPNIKLLAYCQIVRSKYAALYGGQGLTPSSFRPHSNRILVYRDILCPTSVIPLLNEQALRKQRTKSSCREVESRRVCYLVNLHTFVRESRVISYWLLRCGRGCESEYTKRKSKSDLRHGPNLAVVLLDLPAEGGCRNHRLTVCRAASAACDVPA